MRSNIFLHIGAYKTGTSFLQTKIFPLWPNMIYVNDLWLSYLALLEEGKRYIISNETLFGRPWARNNSLSWEEERLLIIKALSRLFPDAQILLSLRKHSKFITSLYKQYLHEGGALKFEQFYDIERDSGILRRDDIIYMNTIRALQTSFSRTPFVFTLEDIEADIHGVLKKLEKLFGEKAPVVYGDTNERINLGVGYWQGKLLRLLNIVDRRPGLFIKKGGLLPLTSNLTAKLRIDPRSLCQQRLKGMSRKQIKVDIESERIVDSYYAKDWAGVEDFVAKSSHKF